MPLYCPFCKQPIPPADFDVSTDAAYCRACDRATTYKQLLTTDPQSIVNATQPHGCWMINDGQTLRIGISLRSERLVPSLVATVIWNGIMATFAISMGNNGAFSQNSYFALMLAPFFAAGLLFLYSCFLIAFGHTEVRLQGDRCSIFTGIGPIGRTRTINISNIRSITRKMTRSDDSSFEYLALTTTTGRTIKFARVATDLRREFLLSALASVLPIAPDSVRLEINPPLKR